MRLRQGSTGDVMFLLLVLMAAASARIVRFLVDDTLIDRQRCWVLGHLQGKLYELATCPWCLSAYVSAGVTLLTWLWVDSMLLPALMWLAVWWLALAFYWTTECLSRYANEGDD
jgi:hypothetical protein